ncbi:MAG: ribonuclease [Eubacterium sp.]|nr:ribonuclease [Eubacterium sp.]
MKYKKHIKEAVVILGVLIAFLINFISGGFTPDEQQGSRPEVRTSSEQTSIGIVAQKKLPKDGSYTSKNDVAQYLHQYHQLPKNFITKKEAKQLGWQGGSLEEYAPGKCIGGDYFGNYENKLPKKKGRKYFECDIDTMGQKSRGSKRIIYSSDGLIYYTGNHYETFEKLYE